MTVARAAESIGCNPETIRRAIRNGNLSCYRFGTSIRVSAEHLQTYLDNALCPARDPLDQSLSATVAGGASHGGKATPVAAFRQERRMNVALDKPLRILKPKAGVKAEK